MHLKRLHILMFYLFMGIFHHTIFASCEKDNNVRCGILRKSVFDSVHILGGTIAKYMQYPWMAAIMRLDRDEGWQLKCGGALINDKFVLTAGHCLRKIRLTDVKLFKVILGMNKIYKKEQYRRDLCIKSAILHEQYDYDQSLNDIGLMQLCEPIKFQHTKIRAIYLPDKDDNNKLYKGLAVVAGWGIKNKILNLKSDKLLAVSLPLGSYKRCAKELKKSNSKKHLYNTTICTYSVGAGKDCCNGDSGGPLMSINKYNGQIYLRGILSFGSRDCLGFSAFTKVSYFLDWIYKNVQKHTKVKKKSTR